jgi:hypothetical protein
VEIPWESVVAQMRFPFVAEQGALLPRRKSAEAVRELLSADDLVRSALEVLGELEEADAEAPQPADD